MKMFAGLWFKPPWLHGRNEVFFFNVLNFYGITAEQVWDL